MFTFSKTAIINADLQSFSIINKEKLTPTGNFVKEYLQEAGYQVSIVEYTRDFYSALEESPEKLIDYLQKFNIQPKKNKNEMDFTKLNEVRDTILSRKLAKQKQDHSDDEK